MISMVLQIAFIVTVLVLNIVMAVRMFGMEKQLVQYKEELIKDKEDLDEHRRHYLGFVTSDYNNKHDLFKIIKEMGEVQYEVVHKLIEKGVIELEGDDKLAYDILHGYNPFKDEEPKAKKGKKK